MPKVIDLPTTSAIDNGDYLIMEESTGGTKKITRGNTLGTVLRGIAIGTTIYPELSIDPGGGSITVELRASGAWHGAILVGGAGGSGGFVIAVLNNNGALTTRNLMTGNAWENPAGLVVSVPDGHHLTLTNNSGSRTYVQIFAS